MSRNQQQALWNDEVLRNNLKSLLKLAIDKLKANNNPNNYTRRDLVQSRTRLRKLNFPQNDRTMVRWIEQGGQLMKRLNGERKGPQEAGEVLLEALPPVNIENVASGRDRREELEADGENDDIVVLPILPNIYCQEVIRRGKKDGLVYLCSALNRGEEAHRQHLREAHGIDN